MEKMTTDGNDIVASTPEEFAAFLRTENGEVGEGGKAAGIKPE
jgi:hypothetical protein